MAGPDPQYSNALSQWSGAIFYLLRYLVYIVFNPYIILCLYSDRKVEKIQMKELLVYRFDVMIDAPIDVVFSYINDDEKIRLWNNLFIENIYESEEDKLLNRPGSKFKSVQIIEKKTYTINTTLIEYDAPYKVVMHSKSKEGKSISKYFLSREYSGTRLIVEASIIPRNIFYLLLTKMLGWTSKFIFEEQYQNLKTYIENEVE